MIASRICRNDQLRREQWLSCAEKNRVVKSMRRVCTSTELQVWKTIVVKLFAVYFQKLENIEKKEGKSAFSLFLLCWKQHKLSKFPHGPLKWLTKSEGFAIADFDKWMQKLIAVKKQRLRSFNCVDGTESLSLVTGGIYFTHNTPNRWRYLLLRHSALNGETIR